MNEDTTGNPNATNLTPSPKPYVDFDNKPYHLPYPVEPDVIINQEEVEVEQYQPGLPNSEDQGPLIKLGIDWDSEEAWRMSYYRIAIQDTKIMFYQPNYIRSWD